VTTLLAVFSLFYWLVEPRIFRAVTTNVKRRGFSDFAFIAFTELKPTQYQLT
jgi:hypothetical protein